jgi:hypothetical protein
MGTWRLAPGDERSDERRIRIEALMAEFREAERRRLVERGLALWRRTEAARHAETFRRPPPPEKVH